MKLKTQESLVEIIKFSLRELEWQFPEQKIYLDLPQNSRFGDISTNIALKLSRELKLPPRETADKLSIVINNNLTKSELKDYVKEIKVEGAGFINFYFNDIYFYNQIEAIVLQPADTLKTDIGRGKKVLIEFVSANPTGPLSVAHARQAAVGDAIANILNFLGFKVKREYYLNDEGNQINILGRSVELRLKELLGEKIEFPADHYHGDYIYDIAKKIKNQKSKIKNISEFAVEYILKIIEKELDDFGVRFDNWYSQKVLGKSGKIERTLAKLRERGFIYDRDGAVWFKSTELGDDKDRVIIKSDKTYTYLAPDIAYHQDKYEQGYEWLINLWGPDHHGYINRLKASVKAFGHSEDSLSIIIVQLATIFRNGQAVQMSTRRGEYITLRAVLEEVGADASRFFFIMRRTSSHLDFDLDVAKKQTSENPVYYIQYAYARICSILNLSGKSSLNPPFVKGGEWGDFHNRGLSVLKEKEEVALIKKICQFTYILNICLNTCDPYMLTVYLQELAESFHKFYDLHRVIGAEENISCARLILLKAAQVVIDTGLKLLGVSRPEKM